MQRANAYAALTKVLEQWRLKPQAALISRIGVLPSVLSAEIAGELISIEVSVSWVDTSHEKLRIEAVANGPSHWNTERLVERIDVAVQPPPAP
jgi:hypothetical protein